LLVRSGYGCQAAASSEEADRRLGSERFDVCLLDIELPRMSGLEFLGWALLKDPEMAVIMLTGVDAPEVALECLDQGARTFLVKPVEAPFLIRAVRDAVALRRLLVEHNDRAGRADPAGGVPWRA
jgi:two-component system C4-dicarboxylate transport response regulator DctD